MTNFDLTILYLQFLNSRETMRFDANLFSTDSAIFVYTQKWIPSQFFQTEHKNLVL